MSSDAPAHLTPSADQAEHATTEPTSAESPTADSTSDERATAVAFLDRLNLRRRLGTAPSLLYHVTPIALFEHLFNLYHSAWCRRSDRRAARDPRWAEIEERRRAHSRPGTTVMIDDSAGLTFDLWTEQQRIERQITPHTWVHRLNWWLGRHPGVSHPVATFRTFFHRGRHGWAPADTWGLDDHLAQVISSAVIYLRDHAHGHPTDLTPERWAEILTTIADGFAAHRDMIDLHDEEARAAHDQRFATAFSLFHTYFPNLWD